MISQLPPAPPKKSGGFLGSIADTVGGLAGAIGTGVSIVNPAVGAAISGAGGALKTVGGLASGGGQPGAAAITPLQTMESHPMVQVQRIQDFKNAIKANPNISNDEQMGYQQKADEAIAANLKRVGRNGNYTA